MTGQGPRYRFVLVEEPAETLPVRYRRTRPFPQVWIRRTDPLEVLLEAFLKLNRRSEGEQAWAPVLSENPLTFLLDAVGDAILVWDRDGALVYANPAARRLAGLGLGAPESLVALDELELAHERFERRCMTFVQGPVQLILEVVRRVT